MKIYKSKGGYYYKEYKNGKKKRISNQEYKKNVNKLKGGSTGKGNANKELMYETFLTETNVDLQSKLSSKSTKIINPVSDIVDSYYICKTGFNS